MKIKKLHLQGFKSFADSTDLHFRDGITSVVGPNGCGKSNVVDALKWAMGEMSAKLLRGQNMEDVIFGGSESRKSVGMAEVSITFENEGLNRPVGYEQYSEIEITRRLYRNGDSAYLINKAPARLRDIQELFMDTGVGARAYSIIEQGQIGALVNARPEDRRYLIEEAAGITKFKKRKEEATRKMEATEQNLLRVGDLAKELKRQLNSLDRQARKAERYKEVQAELRRYELGLLYERHQAASESLAVSTKQLETLTQEETRMSAGVAEQETDSETLKLTIAGLEKELVELRDQAFEAARRVSEHEKDLEVDRSRFEAVSQQIVSLERELEDSDQRRRDLDQEIQSTEGILETLEGELETREEAVRARDAEMSACQREVQELSEAYEETGRNVMELMQRMTEQKALVERARTRRDDLIRRMEDTQSEADAQRIALEDAASTLAESTRRLEEIEAERNEVRTRREAILKEINDLKEELAVALPRLEDARRKLHEKESRLQSLRELEAAHEGLREGVRELLEQAAQDPSRGIQGIVADMIEPSAGIESALAAVLGERLQAILVSDADHAMQAVRYLHEGEGRGRAVFIPTDMTLPETAQPDGVLLAHKLRFHGAHGKIARALLERVLLVESEDEAWTTWNNNPGYAVVTRQGTLIQPDGAVAGGGEEQGTALLRQKREAIELEDEIRERKSALRTLEEDVEEMKRRDVFLQEENEESRAGLHQLEVQLAECQKDLAAARQESDRLTRQLEGLEDDVSTFQSDMDEVLEQLGDGERLLVQINTEREQAVTRREEVTQRHQDARVRLDTLSATVSDLRVELADARSALRNRQELTERLKRDRSGMDERGRRADLELEDSKKRKVELEQRIEAASGGTDHLLEAKIQLEEQVVALAQKYEAEKQSLFERETATRDIRREHDSLRQKLAQEQLKLAELQKDADFLTEQFAERFRVSLDEVTPDDMELTGENEKRQATVADLKRKLDGMGEINLAAIQEYKELDQRYSFIEAQQNDLLESLDLLRKAINKINKTSRDRFQATFDIINEKFQMVFPRLFNGGHAELKLTEDKDLLEAGVEIIAQPPGKKLQRVNLLSGGEKALTAVALIFAIFLLKPSPFCILDEVDAPLDDANIDRFNALLQEMNRLSQIIMITHNKHTMEIADELYGVTMEEMGVSRVVSVQLT